MGIDLLPSQSAGGLWSLYLYSREIRPTFMGHDIGVDGMEISEDWEDKCTSARPSRTLHYFFHSDIRTVLCVL